MLPNKRKKKLILLFPNFFNKKKYPLCNKYFFSKIETFEKKIFRQIDFFFLFLIFYLIFFIFAK